MFNDPDLEIIYETAEAKRKAKIEEREATERRRQEAEAKRHAEEVERLRDALTAGIGPVLAKYIAFQAGGHLMNSHHVMLRLPEAAAIWIHFNNIDGKAEIRDIYVYSCPQVEWNQEDQDYRIRWTEGEDHTDRFTDIMDAIGRAREVYPAALGAVQDMKWKDSNPF